MLACLMVLTLLLLGMEAAYLPAKVATHFDIKGRSNGWMTKSQHIAFSAIFSLTFPLLPLGISSLMRFLPPQVINIPNRDYWLAPVRIKETTDWLAAHSLWFACLTSAFVLCLQLLVAWANLQTPRHLPGLPMTLLTALFLAGMAAWIIPLFRHFSKVPLAAEPSVSPSLSSE